MDTNSHEWQTGFDAKQDVAPSYSRNRVVVLTMLLGGRHAGHPIPIPFLHLAGRDRVDVFLYSPDEESLSADSFDDLPQCYSGAELLASIFVFCFVPNTESKLVLISPSIQIFFGSTF